MIFFYEIHIHDISGIQYKDQPFKMLSDLGKHIFFLLCQQIGALLVFIVLILSGCSSNDHKSRIVSGCRLTDKLLGSSISTWHHGSFPQPTPASKGCSFTHAS